MNESTILLMVLLVTAAVYGAYVLHVVKGDGSGDRVYRRNHPAPRSHFPDGQPV